MFRPSVVLLAIAVAAIAGCKTPCKEGKLDAAWKTAPLSKLLLSDATVCEGSTPTSATVWMPTHVHPSNLVAVDLAEANGFKRTGDNWYSSADGNETPKWSTFTGPAGKLRIDVRESGGGVQLKYELTK